jgi:hypothetical protein
MTGLILRCEFHIPVEWASPLEFALIPPSPISVGMLSSTSPMQYRLQFRSAASQ